MSMRRELMHVRCTSSVTRLVTTWRTHAAICENASSRDSPPFATHESLQKLCAYKREVTLLRKDTHKSTNATTSWFQSFAHAPRVGTVGLQNSASCDHVGESGGKVLGERSAQLLNSSLTSVASTATWARTPTTRTGLLPVSCMLFYFSYSWDHDAILVLLSCLEFIISHYQYTTCLVCFLYI
jgi:hypothetical protein